MKIDRQLVQDIYKQYDNWTDRTKEYNRIKGDNKSRHSLRSNYSRHSSDTGLEINKGVQTTEYLDNGTVNVVNVIAMNHEQSKDKEYILEANGYDPERFYLKKLTVNEWGNKEDYGKQNYQVKLEIVPKTVDNMDMDDLIKLEKSYKYRAKPIKVNKLKTDKTLVVHFTDLHIGDNNTDTEELLEIAKEISEDIQGKEKVVITFLGDILHVDNVSKTTDKGTQLEMNVSAYEMYRIAKDTVIQIIETIATVETEVYWVQGNHSRLAEFALFNGIEDYFNDNTHITFDVSELRRKALLVYGTLIGIFHGDMPKAKQGQWLQYEYAYLWGQAKEWEMVSGHEHQASVNMIGGLEHTKLGTKNGTSEYAYALGYGNYTGRIVTKEYHNGKGCKRITNY